MIAPIAAVGIFLLTIVSSVGYLRIEEREREQESVQRDLEFANQKMRLHLLEQQEQMLRMAREVGNDKFTAIEFATLAMDLVKQYPELASISWIDQYRHTRSSYTSGSAQWQPVHRNSDWQDHPQTSEAFLIAKEIRRSIYSPPIMLKLDDGSGVQEPHMQLHIPIFNNENFKGVVLVDYNLENLLRFAVPTEVTARHAVALVDADNNLLAGQSIKPRGGVFDYAPWESKAYEYSVPVSTVGNSLQLRAQAYRTSQVLIGSGFVLVGVVAQWHDHLDVDRDVAAHPPPLASARSLGGRNQFSASHGKLHLDRHARDGHERAHHLRERGLLPNDRMD